LHIEGIGNGAMLGDKFMKRWLWQYVNLMPSNEVRHGNSNAGALDEVCEFTNTRRRCAWRSVTILDGGIIVGTIETTLSLKENGRDAIGFRCVASAAVQFRALAAS
jgi:hypothetical protein